MDAKYNSDQFLCFKRDGDGERGRRGKKDLGFAVSRAVASLRRGGAKMRWKKASGTARRGRSRREGRPEQKEHPVRLAYEYFSLRTNQPPATSQQYFSLRTNQHQPSATSQTKRLEVRGNLTGTCLSRASWVLLP
jgi:hypothetical protein